MKKIEQIPSNCLSGKDDFIQTLSDLNKTVSIYLVEPLEGLVDLMMETIEICYNREDWIPNFKRMISLHMDIINQIFPSEHPIFIDMNELFVELEWQLEEEPHDNRAYFTDQVLTVAPILSTKMCYYYLQIKEGNHISYLDTRDIIMTDNSYGNGKILTEATHSNITLIDKVLTTNNGVVFMPADIGSSSENYGVSLSKGNVKSQLDSYYQN